MKQVSESRAAPAARGFTLWFTGLSGAGKTTLAKAVTAEIERRGGSVELLDGDEIRTMLKPALGFTRVDRDINVSTLGLIAKLLSRRGIIVVVAAISPYESMRNEIRSKHEKEFIEVFVDASMDVLTYRDVKGLYAKALRGEINEFTGISAPYERPRSPEIYLNTDLESVVECVSRIIGYLVARKLIAPTASADNKTE